LEKLVSFSGPKDTIQNTTIATHFTTNSPRFHHRKTPKNRKTPSKNRPFLPEYFSELKSQLAEILTQSLCRIADRRGREPIHAASEVVLPYPIPQT
jgi:hypothetical protein